MKIESLLQTIKIIKDHRGTVQPVEGNGKNLPFAIKRVYFLDNLDADEPRGFHAHKDLEQLMLVLRGGCTLLLDDGHQKLKHNLVRGEEGLLIHKMIWREMSNFQPGTLIAVFASEHYDESDYIRSYDDFKKLVK